MYIMGENPAMSDPDVDHAREGARRARSSGRAGHLPHRDGLSRRRRAAGDRVAGEDRHGHQHRSHGAARPQGARAARRRAAGFLDHQRAGDAASGLDWHYTHPRDVFDEMRACMPSIAGITWERLERESAVTYPCEKEGDPGEPVVFIERFPDRRTGARALRSGRHHSGGRASGRASIRWCSSPAASSSTGTPAA